MSDPTDNGDRPDRSERNSARSNERAARNNERSSGDRDSRSSGADRPARSSSDRPARPSNDRADRPARGGDRPDRGDRPARSGAPPANSNDRPARSGDRPDRPARSTDRQPGRPTGDRGPRTEGGSRPPRAADGKKLWTDRGAPARGDKDAGARNAAAAAEWEDRDPFNTRSVRNRHEDPIIPDDVTPDDLDRVARNELKTLAKDNAEGVAQHLAMAARLIESDPTLAHAHAMSAARRAGRIGVVRETLAITAYATGDYALALRELRTHRRITGRDDQLPLMVDCERALGRPDKALELARSIPKSTLPVAVQVELAIAMSGARLDQGNPQAALQEVTIPQLDPTHVFSYSPDLFAAYATCLEDLGRDDEAETWWAHADTAQEALDQRDLGIDGETIDIYEDDLVEDDLYQDDFTEEELAARVAAGDVVSENTTTGEPEASESDAAADSTTSDSAATPDTSAPDAEENNAPTDASDASETADPDSEDPDTDANNDR
jgi:hypothetical protein